MGPEDLESLEEILDLLSDPQALKEISEAREEISSEAATASIGIPSSLAE